MSTRLSASAICLCSLALAAALPLSAQSLGTGTTPGSNASRGVMDPGEFYLGAYQLIAESERLAGQKDYNAAIRKGREAERMLAVIVRDFPAWKPNLVQYRRTALARSLADYAQKAKDNPIPTGRQPGSHVATTVELPNAPAPATRPSFTVGDNAENRRLRADLARAQEDYDKLSKAYKELSTKAADDRRKLTTAELEARSYKQRYNELQQRIETEREAGNQVIDSLNRQLSDMEARYHAADQARVQAEQRISELENTLALTQADLERVTRERDALKKENEQLHAIVDLNSPEKTKALLDQNLTLDQRLKESMQRVADLEAQMESEGDERSVLAGQLQAARAETERLREEMARVYDENMGYRTRVSTLTERLNNLEAELESQAGKPVVDPALAEENQLLRELIAKQRRTLEIQDDSRRLLIETYKQIQNNDAATLDALKRLEDESNPDLTDAERRMLETIRTAASPGQDSRQAEEQAAKAVRAGLETQALASLAEKAFSKKRYTAAEQLYRTLVDSEPDNVPGLVNLGTILIYRNRYADSVEFLTRAQRLSPRLAVSYYLAAIAHYRLDRMEDARRLFARTIELDPGNAESFFYLANIEGLNEDFDRALKHYAAAIKLKPQIADAHYNMARIYAEAKKIPDAARAYDRAIHYGAEPDPEFESYLRNHPDNTQAPGTDLVETITPEDEAAALREEDGEMKQILAEKAEQEAAEAASKAAAEAKAKADAAFDDRLARLRETVIQAAPTASSAGAGHEWAQDRFGTVTIHKRGNRIKLRLKKPEPKQLRKRGGDIRKR